MTPPLAKTTSPSPALPAAARRAVAWTRTPPQGDGGPDDAALIRAALAGDEGAFAGLVRRYERRAFWIAYHVVGGDVEEARDVAQESFLRLFRSLHRYDFARSFYTWYYRIVVNLAIDRVRKLAPARAARLDDVEFALPAGDDLRPAVEQGEVRDLVWTVLEQLDPKFRAVLVLRDIHGMSCREIAPILRCTHATARWRLHRGRQLFRERWERLERAQGGES